MRRKCSAHHAHAQEGVLVDIALRPRLEHRIGDCLLKVLRVLVDFLNEATHCRRVLVRRFF